MADVCSNPEHPPATVMVPGERRIRIPALTIEWGDNDLRDTFTDEYVFCSFECLASWATEMAGRHDGPPLVEGPPPEEPHPEHPIVLPPEPIQLPEPEPEPIPEG